jgi:hypothetical protein
MTTSIEDRAPRSLGGLILPLILIGLGAAFLLANLGYLRPISLRALIEVWPIALILIGIEMLLGRRQPLVAFGLQLVALALAVALVASQSAGLLSPASAATTSDTVARDGATALALDVSTDMGDLTITGGASALVETRATGGGIEVSTEREDGRAQVEVGPDRHFVLPFQGLRTDLEVVVAGDIPAALRVEIGAGDARLDLRGLRITDARVDAGAGDVFVSLPTPQGEVALDIDAGAAEITIEVPSGVEARVTVEGGAVSLDSVNARLTASGRTAQTAGYATASARVTVTIDAGAASVHIR